MEKIERGVELNFVLQRSDAAEKFNSVESRNRQNESWSQSEPSERVKRVRLRRTWHRCINIIGKCVFHIAGDCTSRANVTLGLLQIMKDLHEKNLDPAPLKMKSYCMSGFSDALDWRPILFQEPTVAQSACSLCGLVLLKSVRLSCAHTLCTDCHEECARQGSACPLDDEPFDDQSFVRLEVSGKFIEKLKVACWNKPSGCSFVGPIASLLEHYKECAFHTVSCPACQSTLLRSEIVGHVKGGCRVCPDESGPSDSTPHHTHVAKMSNELQEALCRLSDDLSSLQTSFNQCREDVRKVERRSKEHFKAQSKMFWEDLKIAHVASATVLGKYLTKELREQSQKLLSATNGACRKVLSFCGAREVHWYFEKWTSLKKKAMDEGTARAESPPEYVCGYKTAEIPVNQVELLYFLCRLADDANLRVAVNNYLKRGLITGGSAIFGAILLGPLGFLVGGVLGGFTAFLATQDKFMPVIEIIDRMSEREEDELHRAIERVFSDVDITDVAKLEALIYGNLDMKEMMTAALMNNIEKGMRKQIIG
ncbi:hypothetical protein HPB47_013594 [Ixodes persulcatus]|uniref:Uncharacterized protein n=1 Tax=Ixodes persulcatus TaxID=34615 RepID=A0AC60QYB9_IXOPE|nr:hypothetical protein HPB47_013594 [Ixodes persulcatus]